MIVYDLICGHQHRFEGWFASADDFARQREGTLIRCPLCDDAAIERRPSANVQVGRAAAPAEDHGEGRAKDQKEVAVAGGDGHVLKLMRRLIADCTVRASASVSSALSSMRSRSRITVRSAVWLR